jgi:hypothetical protein
MRLIVPLLQIERHAGLPLGPLPTIWKNTMLETTERPKVRPAPRMRGASAMPKLCSQAELERSPRARKAARPDARPQVAPGRPRFDLALLGLLGLWALLVIGLST